MSLVILWSHLGYKYTGDSGWDGGWGVDGIVQQVFSYFLFFGFDVFGMLCNMLLV